MFQRVTLSDFIDAFRAHGRESQFSYEAKEALFNYIEQLEEETGEPVELDVVGLCCEYEEASVDDIIEENGLDASSCEDDDGRRALAEKYLADRTTVVWHDGDTFLFQQF
jgi:hypothetical protein